MLRDITFISFNLTWHIDHNFLSPSVTYVSGKGAAKEKHTQTSLQIKCKQKEHAEQ